MHVHVEQRLRRKRRERIQRRLLGDLAQRDEPRIGLALAVSSGLQPAAELAMEEQQHALPRGIEHEAAAREVPGGLRLEVRVGGMRGEEVAHEGDVPFLLLVGAGMLRKLPIEQRPLAIHVPRTPPPQARAGTLPPLVDGAKSALRFALQGTVIPVGNLCSIRHFFLVLTNS